MKKFTAFCLFIVMFMSCNVFADVKNVKDTVASFVTSTDKNCIEYGSIGGEWLVLDVARSGETVSEDFFAEYYSKLCTVVKSQKGVLDERKYTNYARCVIALTAIGKNPENVEGYNILKPLADFDKVTAQGLNGAVFALTALDCGNYSMPKCSAGAVQAEREKYVDFILSRQNVDGSFSFVSGGNGDVDITAMAVQALSNYVDTENVKNGIDKALNYISSIQTENGGFMSGGVETCESSAQVLVALGELGIDADTDARFIKNGKTVADSVMSFKNGTGFKHIYAENTVNQMSTEQAIYALSSYLRVKNGMNSLYDMSEEKSVDETKAEILEMAEKIKKAMAA